MAKSGIPDPLKRRHLLVQELPAVDAARIGEAYLEAGRLVEAIPFLVRGECGDALAELRERATQEGDPFLLRELVRAGGEPAAPALWERVAEAAEAHGKLRYAADARRLADRGK